MRTMRYIAAVGALILALTGCAMPAAEKSREAAPSAMAAGAPASPAAPGEPSPASDASQAAAKATAIPRKVIYEGYVTLEADQVGPVLTKVVALARRVGGYEGNMEQTSGDRQSASAVLRVPADKFGQVMDELAKLGRPLSRRVEAKDVGEEWVDLEARIKTKRQEEQRLLELLDKAGNVSSLLEVERELARVRGEIEQAEGRLKYLGNQVALSTIHVDIHSPAGVAPVPGWRVATVVRHAGQAFVVIGRALIGLAIYVLFLAPYWLLLAWLLRRGRRRRPGPPAATLDA